LDRYGRRNLGRSQKHRPAASTFKSIAAPLCSSSIAFDEALAGFDSALKDDPGNVVALINRGSACIKDKRFAEALRSYDSALAVDPDQANALRDRCIALAEMDRFEEALASIDQALHIEPHVVAAHVNRGNALLKLARLEEALASYNEALRLDPEQIDANFNASLTRMCLGDLRRGFKQYEYRWKKKEFGSQRREYPQPIWTGDQDLHGKTILLVHEQGLGDTIQFIRYAPMVAAFGANVILGVQPVLKAVAATVPGVKHVFGDGDVLPDFDFYCALLSLPVAFGTELETIPANVPYIRPYKERLAKWRGRLPDNGRLRVGICWAGNSAHLNDRKRSMPLDRLAAVLSLPGVDFFSAQKDVGEAQSAILRDHGVIELGRDFDDFADTAAAVAMLDLVITVDTSVAHLAGAMGKGVALLIPFSPDFRWLLDRTDSPWYPTMRIFRQSKVGDWDAPVAQLRDELATAAGRRRSPATARG
jgi:tetratricopeptide (TPR) repeat protein